MYSQKWTIGIDLCQSTIQLVAAKQSRKRWSLCECWQQNIPNQLASQSENDKHTILLKILKQWRQKLPKNCQVSIAFPLLRTLKQQVALPEMMPRRQPELGWYLHARAEKLFPLSPEELIVDYRIINNQAYLNGTRKSEIAFWQNLCHQSGFSLVAIDVTPCALRYLARNAGLPDESWLVHHRQGEWLWSGPVSQYTQYNQIITEEIANLSQLIPLLNEQQQLLSQPVYYISDHPDPLAPHTWHLLQAFHHHNIKIPHQLGDFVVAAGLALRQRDNEYVSS